VTVQFRRFWIAAVCLRRRTTGQGASIALEDAVILAKCLRDVRTIPDALAAYETFLAQADPKTNQLEIEKVRLRLPPLKRQIQLKQGVKHTQ